MKDREEIIKKILDNSWSIEIDPTAAYECEWGTTGNIGFAHAEMINAEGNVVETPKCDKCNEYKQCVIGKEVIAWVCGSCNEG